MLRQRIQFFPCSHCSVVYIDCDARRTHYRIKHPKKALPKDFIDFQPSIEIVPKQYNPNDLEDDDESLFEKHFSLPSSNNNAINIQSSKVIGKKSTAANKRTSPKKTSPSAVGKKVTAKKSPTKAVKTPPKAAAADQTAVAKKSTTKPRAKKSLTKPLLDPAQDPAINGSMNNLISIQNVQFVANPNHTAQSSGNHPGGDANSTMGPLNQQTKVAFMPISDGSNIVPIAMTNLMGGTPLYANIAHHPGQGQQQLQFVQVCPQPVQIMDGQAAQNQAQVGQMIATTGQLQPAAITATVATTNGKKGRGKKAAAAKATENRVQIQVQAPVKEKKMKNNGKRYNCSQCPKYFSTIYNRRRHEEMFHAQAQASNSQQFRCETCDKAFPNLFNLTRHENIHKPITERLRYKCEMVNCKRRFTTLFILKTHLRKVHNMEPNF